MLLWGLGLMGQRNQNTYLEAKALFSQGAYLTAQKKFTELVNDEVFGSYASFYYALSAIRLDNRQEARDMWLQMVSRYPKFDQINEVHYWLTYLYFEQAAYGLGLSQAESLGMADREKLYATYLAKKNLPFLIGLAEQYNTDKALAHMLVRVAERMQLPPDQQVLIEQIADKHRLDYEPFQAYRMVKKDSYSVAVLLPFMAEEPQVFRNQLVTDLYQGMQLAVKMLKEQGVTINLYPYDTQKSAEATEQILSQAGLDQIDLIVGPLYPESGELAQQFSLTRQINLLNPVSSSSDWIHQNPFGLLLPPAYETMAQQLAAYTSQRYRSGDVWIYYEENSRDQAMAEAYRRAVEATKKLKVGRFEPINQVTMNALSKQFTEQRVRYLGISAQQAEVLRGQGRDIRSRRRFNEAGNEVRRPDGSPDLIYYEIQFANGLDSLSHIFGVTRKNLYASNFVSLMEVNGDSVGMVGLGEWLDFNMLAYNQLERLGIVLLHPDYLNRDSDLFASFEKAINDETNSQPSLFHAFGFESIWWAGQMMAKYGTYFQLGFNQDNSFIGSLFCGRKYQAARDNQEVAIVAFENHALKRVNQNVGN